MWRYLQENQDDAGAVAAEYGLLLTCIILVIFVGILAYGNALLAFIARLAGQIATLLS